MKKPSALEDLKRFCSLVECGKPFTFVRFSDGEVEIIRNRKLIIKDGITHFQGRQFSNKFGQYDDKVFNPQESTYLRSELLYSAILRHKQLFKGIPTSHNNAVSDKDLLLRLNGGMNENMTFSDLLINSNYLHARKIFFPNVFKKFTFIGLVANYRAIQQIGHNVFHYKVGDNAFSEYPYCVEDILVKIRKQPLHSAVLSSASSLSNIIGVRVLQERPDITFIDVGTSINDLLTMPTDIRGYHCLLAGVSTRDIVKKLIFQLGSQHKIRW